MTSIVKGSHGAVLRPELMLEDVSVRLGDVDVLSAISLRVQERRVGIVGRNGSGKTTLARIIAGLQAPTRGSARIDGDDMARDRKAALRAVGILFQNPDHQIIFPTVDEEIAFGLMQLGHDRDAAARETSAILSRFGKSGWHGAATHSLSQGQKQLVCLMAVLAMRPRLIVLDEPYSGLDIPTRMQLVRYVDAVEASVVQITHDPDHVRAFDRVIWLDEGSVRMDGPTDEVLAAFEAQMTAWGQDDDLSDLAG
ncbi:energy-coupling factor ABC transporter ATP-binding protein [Maritimibacter alexandrii]|uniref:energy-coupling factor ABC transporter ATP-binding protein n=1 Tax=Maritimibacter alexandrii TaxID=2570355 RepID=UPI00148743F3|nr:ABC transporter ATP-binding protein [Maritimibacter alexandrii]